MVISFINKLSCLHSLFSFSNNQVSRSALAYWLITGAISRFMERSAALTQLVPRSIPARGGSVEHFRGREGAN